MKIDAHQHFWRYNPAEYDWIDDAMRAIRMDFSPESLAPFLTASDIDGTIAVQARQSFAETNWLLELAQKHPLIKGVVGWVPLANPDVAGILEPLAQNPRFKGVRHVVQSEPDPAFLTSAAFNRGIRVVTRLKLVYDLLVLAPQLPATIKFVDLHPQQTFVLDHIAKPVVQGPPPAEWRQNLRELARRGNVSCKFSGVVNEVPGWKWTSELLRPYFDVALEAFGPRRLMFGSDWPVCLVASSYERWINFVEDCVAKLSVTEQADILCRNATAIYRL